MTNSTNRVEIITSVQRRRRWTAPEKVRMVEETFEPGMTVSLVARRHGVAPNQLFAWRRLVAQGSLTAAGSGEASGAMTAALQWMNVIGVGAPTALRSAATTASGCGLRLHSTAVIGKP
jgi:transposase-like protein